MQEQHRISFVLLGEEIRQSRRNAVKHVLHETNLTMVINIYIYTYLYQLASFNRIWWVYYLSMNKMLFHITMISLLDLLAVGRLTTDFDRPRLDGEPSF